MSDAEHEQLWSVFGEEVGLDMRYQPTGVEDALAPSVNSSTRAWSVTPGRTVILGHVLDITSTQSGTLAAGSVATRIDILTCYVNHSTNPWTYGIGVRQGAPGGGRPVLSKSFTGLYEVGLAQIQVTAAGAATMMWDLRGVPNDEDWGPGTAVANPGIGFTQIVVNTLTVSAAPWPRYLEVSAGCYLDPSLTTDVFDVRLFWNGAPLSYGGRWRKQLQGIDTAVVTGPRTYVAEQVAGSFTLRVNRVSGNGLVASSADSSLNHINVTTRPA